MHHWFIEYFVSDHKTRHRIKINQFPFKVGRQADLPLAINSPDMSRHHAEFTLDGEQLILHDLNSTNGTFINHSRISTPSPVMHGDIVHFANVEYRVICEDPFDSDADADKTKIGIPTLSNHIPRGLQFLQELLEQTLTTAVFQPIIVGHDESLFGYEILGRGLHPNLPTSPIELLKLAESAGHEVALSEMFRTRGLQLAAQSFDNNLHFLMNTHPAELKQPERLINSIQKTRQLYPATKLILEIHEEAITDLQTIKFVNENLLKMNVQMAYDDFGSGQARMVELAEAPPFILKFDICLVQNIQSASPAHQHMVKTMIQLCKDSGIHPLAEGVSTLAESKTCRTLSFDLLQGYHYPMVTI